MTRTEILARVQAAPAVDVLIVGGSIQGVSLFRDLAANGVGVLLIDEADFGSGEALVATHLLLESVRRLRARKMPSLRQMSVARARLLQSAPHLARPLPVVVPLFRPRGRSLWSWLRVVWGYQIGLWLSDQFGQQALPRHRVYGQADALQRWPRLNATLASAVVYAESALFSPHRYAIELLLDGEAENPQAVALNYAQLLEVKGHQALFRDEVSGETFAVQPRLLINAAGAQADQINQTLGFSTHLAPLTKETYFVLASPTLYAALQEHGFLFEGDGKGTLALVPHAGRVLASLDGLPTNDSDAPLCTEQDIEALFSALAYLFPDLKVGRDQLVFHAARLRSCLPPRRFAAVQPIQVFSGAWTGLDFPVYRLAEEPWLLHRLLAHQVTEKALNFLGQPRRKNTQEVAVGGGRNYPVTAEEQKRYLDGLMAWTGLPAERVRALWERYGTRAEAIALALTSQTDPLLNPLQEFSRREITFLVQQEKVVHLDDLLLRRTDWALLGNPHRQGVEQVAGVVAPLLGWDEARKQAEVARTLEVLATRYGVWL